MWLLGQLGEIILISLFCGILGSIFFFETNSMKCIIDSFALFAWFPIVVYYFLQVLQRTLQ